jgi:hypothetical protein
LSRKEGKSRTQGPKLRSTRTKARTRISRVHEPRAELEKKLERCTHELDEARKQLAATSEVLQAISSSPGELAPVFQAMLENAVRICEAGFGTLYTYDGNGFRAAAFQNAPRAFVEARTREPMIHPPPDTPL